MTRTEGPTCSDFDAPAEKRAARRRLLARATERFGSPKHAIRRLCEDSPEMRALLEEERLDTEAALDAVLESDPLMAAILEVRDQLHADGETIDADEWLRELDAE